MEDIDDIDRAAAFLEVRSDSSRATLFCRDLSFAKEMFPGCRLMRGHRGWSLDVDSSGIYIKQDSLFLGSLGEEETKQGSPLLHGEERVLFLWQRNGSLVVSCEDRSWNEYLSQQSYAKRLLSIERPGADTCLWRLPKNTVLFSLPFGPI